MKKAEGIFFAILAIFLLLGAFSSPISNGIKSLRTEDKTQTASVTTGAGVTTANVTLTNDLYQDDTANVVTITSNVTGDSPAASTYTTATKVLLVSGLLAGQTHTLTIEYDGESESDVMRVVGPFLGFLIFGFLIFVIVRSAMSHGRK